ncbi:MAG: hypothetical protein GAK39_01332 [Variovorax sp.]|nr:MAG: hypothetical protein GAK39_01332 [Variovorax sp.]
MRIAGVRMRTPAPLPAAVFGLLAGRAASAGFSPANRKTQASSPARPVAAKAQRTPSVLAMPISRAGAMAPPTKPAKVWTEKALPMRALSMPAESIA